MQHDSDEPADRRLGRRRLLRGAGVAAAGAAGAAVAATAGAVPAAAATGDPVLQGAANNAGKGATGLTTGPALNRATLELGNTTAAAPDARGAVRNGAALRLTPAGDLLSSTAPPGSIGMSKHGDLWLVPGVRNGVPFREYVYTSGVANTLVPTSPTRVVDTRGSGGRGRVINPVALNRAGQVSGGQSIHIDLSPFTVNSYAIFVNLTVVGAPADGYATLYPFNGGNRPPNASNVNYSPKLYALSNFAVCGTGYTKLGDGRVVDCVSIYSNVAVHVIMDLVAVAAPSWAHVNPAILAGAAAARSGQDGAGATLRSTPPSWYRGDD